MTSYAMSSYYGFCFVYTGLLTCETYTCQTAKQKDVEETNVLHDFNLNA